MKRMHALADRIEEMAQDFPEVDFMRTRESVTLDGTTIKFNRNRPDALALVARLRKARAPRKRPLRATPTVKCKCSGGPWDGQDLWLTPIGVNQCSTAVMTVGGVTGRYSGLPGMVKWVGQ